MCASINLMLPLPDPAKRQEMDAKHQFDADYVFVPLSCRFNWIVILKIQLLLRVFHFSQR